MMKGKVIEGKRIIKKSIGRKNPVGLESTTFNKILSDKDPKNLPQIRPSLYKVNRKSSSAESNAKRLQSISEIQELLESSKDSKEKVKTTLLKHDSNSLGLLQKVKIHKSCEEIGKTYALPRKVTNILDEIRRKKQLSELSLSKHNITKEVRHLELTLPKVLSLEDSKLNATRGYNCRWNPRKRTSNTAVVTEKSQSYDCLSNLMQKKIPNKCSSAENGNLKNKFVEIQRSNLYENTLKNGIGGKKPVVPGNQLKSRKKSKDGFPGHQGNFGASNPSTTDLPNGKTCNEAWDICAGKKKNLEICYCPHIHTENYVRKICLQTSASPTSKFNPQLFKLNYFSTPEKDEEREKKSLVQKNLSLKKISSISEKKSMRSIQRNKAKKTGFERKVVRNSKTKVSLKLPPPAKKPEKKEKPKKIDLGIKDSLDKISIWRNDNQMRILGKQKKATGGEPKGKKLSFVKRDADIRDDFQKKKDELEILEKLYLKLDSVEKLLKKKTDGHSILKPDYRICFADAKKKAELAKANQPTFFYGNDKELKKRKLKHAVLDRALQWFDSGFDESTP